MSNAPAAPLTPGPLTPAPSGLSWTEDGAPRSERFGDVYFSKDDGLAESRAVFLQGCGLPQAWDGRDRFTVGELGFGTGLNIVALLDLWRRERPAHGRLHVFSIEAYPLTAAEAERALAAWPELATIARPLLDAWPSGAPGFHRIALPELGATIDLAVGEVDWALSQWTGQADAWFLDGFSPALNPAMWSPEVMALIAARSAPDARLATFTVAGAVRRALTDQGFEVDKRPGHGRKRERLEARLPGPPAAEDPAKPSVVVIGAGIAGAAVARALTAEGLTVSIIEAEGPGAGASGFPAALVTPRFDTGDAAIAGLHAQALDYAGALYRAIPGAVIAQGVLQLEQAPRDAARFAKVAAQPLWPAGAMTPVSPHDVGQRLGEAGDTGGLWMAEALAVAPAPILAALLEDVVVLAGTVTRLETIGAGWRLHRGDGQTPLEADAVVVAGGWGTAALLPQLSLRPVRGQANWTEGDAGEADNSPVAWGGYLAPTPGGVLFGATHDRDQQGTEVRAEDTRRNLDTLAARLPGRAAALDPDRVRARAAIRATTRDRLPLCGAVPGQDGLYVLGGLGSRGFCVAPLLGVHLAALLSGAPSPLPTDFARRLAPERAIDPSPGRAPLSAPDEG